MTAQIASLPMYALPSMAAANAAFWGSLRAALLDRGLADVPAGLSASESVPQRIGPDVLFTQVCGFPLYRRYGGQGVLLGTPCYDFAGCTGAMHRAAFIVRGDDPAADLAGLRGRVFGCNSIDSNTGMNLPRLSLARIAGSRPFFSRVVWTGGHVPSLAALSAG